MCIFLSHVPIARTYKLIDNGWSVMFYFCPLLVKSDYPCLLNSFSRNVRENATILGIVRTELRAGCFDLSQVLKTNHMVHYFS